ncbi:MAG: HAD hydrolase family protein [Acidobacteria bacterium]|nr:HAD hydrolase family protein [Acidobacteriota bacterium]
MAASLPSVGESLAGIGRVRVVYTDLDGTMLGRGGSFFHDADGAPSSEPAEALLAAHAAGLDIVPTSGRALRGLLGDARIFGLTTVIAEMGALVAYEGGRTVARNFGETPALEPGEMPAARMTEALDLVLSRFRLEPHAPWAAGRECTLLLRGLADPDEVDAALAAIGHGWLTLADNGRLRGPYLGLAPGEARVYHLTPRGVSKGTAAALDRTRRGIARSECIAIGDAVADLSLAEHVGLLVLVRDAIEADPQLAARAAATAGVAVTERPMNLGWTDTVRAILG